MGEIPYPGDLKNMIKTALAFSDPEDEYGYLRKLYISINGEVEDIKALKKKGFTIREIEVLTGISKSQVSREIKG